MRIRTYLQFQKLTESLGSQFYYHGSSQIGGEGILATGKINPSGGNHEMLSPIAGRVYLAQDLKNCMAYCLGGSYTSIIKGMDWASSSGDTGYVFLVDHTTIAGKSQIPDEDAVGMLLANAMGCDTLDIQSVLPHFIDIDDDIKSDLCSIYEYIDHDGYDDGEGTDLGSALDSSHYDAYAYVGKEVIKRLGASSYIYDTMIEEYRAHFSVAGALAFTRAYSFDKHLAVQLKTDLSNFFQLAQQIK